MVETVDIPVKREVRQKIWIIERGYEPDWYSRVGPVHIKLFLLKNLVFYPS